MKYTPPRLLCLATKMPKIKYWFFPKEREIFYVIKDYGAY
jgi:hypothetical protein